MKVFSLEGYNGEHITMYLKEVLGFPNSTSYEGGYDIICSLEIVCGCYTVTCDRYFSATGALYRFQDELKRCYESLEGKAKYALLLENDLIFEVHMTASGKAAIVGNFRERPDSENNLTFEIITDQTCFVSVIQDIDALKAKFGDKNTAWNDKQSEIRSDGKSADSVENRVNGTESTELHTASHRRKWYHAFRKCKD